MGTQRVVVVTGVTGSIGGAAAAALASLGHHVVLMGRDEQKVQEVAKRIQSVSAGAKVTVVVADLSSLQSVRGAAAAVLKQHPRLDGLINNAAILSNTRRTTVDGGELMFATNHLGPYLLTRLLMPALHASGNARVINVTAPSTTQPKWEDIDEANKFSSFHAFGASKMCNLLFTYACDRRWGSHGVRVLAFHPGLVKSTLLKEMPAPVRFITNLLSSSAEKAGAALAALVTDAPIPGTDRFYKLLSPLAPPAYALDGAAQDRLWKLSAERTSLPAEDALQSGGDVAAAGA